MNYVKKISVKITALSRLFSYPCNFGKCNTNKILIQPWSFKMDQVSPNTRVPTQFNTSQPESKRVNTSPTRVNMIPRQVYIMKKRKI